MKIQKVTDSKLHLHLGRGTLLFGLVFFFAFIWSLNLENVKKREKNLIFVIRIEPLLIRKCASDPIWFKADLEMLESATWNPTPARTLFQWGNSRHVHNQERERGLHVKFRFFMKNSNFVLSGIKLYIVTFLRVICDEWNEARWIKNKDILNFSNYNKFKILHLDRKQNMASPSSPPSDTTPPNLPMQLRQQRSHFTQIRHWWADPFSFQWERRNTIYQWTVGSFSRRFSLPRTLQIKKPPPRNRRRSSTWKVRRWGSSVPRRKKAESPRA